MARGSAAKGRQVRGFTYFFEIGTALRPADPRRRATMTLTDKFDVKGIVAVTLRRLGSGKPYLIVAFLAITAGGIYGLNRGIFVGSAEYFVDQGIVQKRCRYLFVTGVSEIPARGSVFDGLGLPPGLQGMRLTDRRDNLYCGVFGD